MVDQFRTGSPIRAELDDAVLRALGVATDDAHVLGKLFREAVSAKLEGLLDSTHKKQH